MMVTFQNLENVFFKSQRECSGEGSSFTVCCIYCRFSDPNRGHTYNVLNV